MEENDIGLTVAFDELSLLGSVCLGGINISSGIPTDFIIAAGFFNQRPI
jgi:hypothetical protein